MKDQYGNKVLGPGASVRGKPLRCFPRAPRTRQPKVLIKTFGCQMNVRDSEVICGLLEKEGYKITDRAEDADIVLFNTCSVRQHAEDKVWSEIGKYKLKGPSLSLRTNHPSKKIIGVIGCMAQNYKDKVFERAPNVDFAVGPSDIHKIPDIIKNLSAKNIFEKRIWETDGGIRPEEIYHTGFYEDKDHAFVVISEGCSNYCSYCVVPYVRGELRNRNYQDILKEIEEAVEKGITRITLLGQNVNAYEDKDVNFVSLVRLVKLVKGLKEISFITSHPKDIDFKLFALMQDADKIKKYLHLPVQSGSDRILKLMHRGYTRQKYLDIIENYRNTVKGAVLSTDLIVGFPTETEEDFNETLDLVKTVQFDNAYIFKYSVRHQTSAQNFPDDVPLKEKQRRHKILLDLQKQISKNKR